MPDIIMHFPKKQEDIYILQRKIALIHAEAVVKHIEKMSCPKEQKMALLTAVKKGCLQTILRERISNRVNGNDLHIKI
ncbi:MAG: hypothetical protein FWD98_07390 [Defluviitaleaceae bacterium]|nr:hypothetical protein [Defluviitaleaceae bacterium]